MASLRGKAYRFHHTQDYPAEPITLAGIRRLVEDVLSPAHFFLGPDRQFAWRHAAVEDTSWEIFQGRLLDPAHTRRRQTFETFNIYSQCADGASGEPVLSVKMAAEERRLFVVRALECYVHEGYDSGGGVILTREARKWARELTGTIDWQQFSDLAELRDELVSQLFHAVVGTSRLPLHSVEAPQPAFSFGDLFYCYRSVAASEKEVRGWPALLREMLTKDLNPRAQAKLLEIFLHAVPMGEMTQAVRRPGKAVQHPVCEFWARWQELGKGPDSLMVVLRALFNEVSLSPWTDLVDKVLGFLKALEGDCLAADSIVDFLGHLLRQTGRHLTAYDLVTFHYRGANYPDALLLDAMLKAYLQYVEQRPDLFLTEADGNPGADFVKRRRRRALRQAWLLRRHYEGHAVPDLPTSPGENNRVLPASHPRVPEEQINHSSRRVRQLFAGDPLPDQPAGSIGAALRQSVADLEDPAELRELGLGLFIERPFGAGKAPAEPDNTLLLAATAFSRALAIQRARFLERLGLAERAFVEEIERRLDREPIRGLPLDAIGALPRPGAMSLSLARQAMPDFVFLRTVPGSVNEFVNQFDISPLAGGGDLSFLTGGGPVLFALAPAGDVVLVYDRDFRPRLALEPDLSEGWVTRAGCEFPACGLRARWVGEGEVVGLAVKR